MNRFHILMFGTALCLTSLASTAQTRPEGHRIVTRTRLQVVFSDLENQWLTAVQKKDKVSLDKLLAESFEEWTPTQRDPIPLEDWTQQAFSRTLQSFQLRQLAVRAVDDNVSVASFVLSQSFKQGGKAQTEDTFVVDVWVKDADNWRCTDRYASQVPAKMTPPQDAKPTGKQ